MRDKRKWLDYIITVPATVLCAPVLVGIAIWVRLDSPGPVFFRQKRVGIHQNYFEILKFRTMRTDTPENVPAGTSGTVYYKIREVFACDESGRTAAAL